LPELAHPSFGVPGAFAAASAVWTTVWSLQSPGPRSKTVKNRRTQSALLIAGAAAGAVAATWIGKRRLRAVGAEPVRALVESDSELLDSEPGLIEPESAELPVGASADPDIDHTLSRSHLPQDSTTGGALRGDVETSSEAETRAEVEARDGSLDDVWNAMPGSVPGEQSESYDAVPPEDLGAVWLERATQTTHDERLQATDPNESSDLEALGMSEGSVLAARAPDEVAEENEENAENEENEIADDDLDVEAESRKRSNE
jgi:hypothetical protein